MPMPSAAARHRYQGKYSNPGLKSRDFKSCGDDANGNRRLQLRVKQYCTSGRLFFMRHEIRFSRPPSNQGIEITDIPRSPMSDCFIYATAFLQSHQRKRPFTKKVVFPGVKHRSAGVPFKNLAMPTFTLTMTAKIF